MAGQQKAIKSWRGSTDRLDQIIIPTLILCGSEDVLAPPHNSEKLNNLIHGSKLHLVKGAGHGLMFQEPALFATLVDDFLRAEAGRT